MTNEESPSIRLMKEELREMELQREDLEKELKDLKKKIKKWRETLHFTETGKHMPSPNSSAGRIIYHIKSYLRAHGPATLEEILAHLRTASVEIKGEDEVATVKQSLGTSMSVRSIIKDGETYRLP